MTVKLMAQTTDPVMTFVENYTRPVVREVL
jgi:hypothetical protein